MTCVGVPHGLKCVVPRTRGRYARAIVELVGEVAAGLPSTYTLTVRTKSETSSTLSY